jgi:hypothetical protein
MVYRDYQGALEAGLEPRLIRRPGAWSEGAKRETEESEGLERDGIHIVRSLNEIVDEVELRRRG